MSDRTETRERILTAAMQLWAEKGYERATMRELARRVGTSASALYQHFESKEAIVLFFYERLNAEVGAVFDADGPSGDVGADLARYLRLKLERLVNHRSAVAGLLSEAVHPDSRLSPLHRDSSSTLTANVERFAGWVEHSGLASGEAATDLGRALWLLHLGVIAFWLHDRSEGRTATEQSIERLPGLVGMLPMATMMVPGFADGLALLRALTTAREADVEIVDEAPTVDHQVDVVVVGGGPIGCLTAAFLKQQRPRTRVLVLERDPEPTHKVGESTLSGFCKALRTLGIRQDALRTLFQGKNGLAFLWGDDGVSLSEAPEYVLETFDETFQVERRVLDTLVIAQVRRMGVEVLQGAEVDLKKSEISGAGSVVRYRLGRHEATVGATWIVDATGPSARLARMNGLWTDEGLPFQTSAVWAYLERATPMSQRPFSTTTRFSRDEYTWHLCTRPGWLWWIPQVSFTDAPASNLNQAIDAMLREGRLPARDALAHLGCPATERVSVGLVVRSDRDVLGLKADPAAAFAAARKRWPALETLVGTGSLVEDPDGTGQGPFRSRLEFRGHARRVVGDGWLAVGDAAFFVDPLISPGLTAGTATAWAAATALAEGLQRGAVREAELADYDTFVHRLHAGLEADNQLVYHSFDHPELMALVQRFQEITARTAFLDADGQDYGLADTNVWGILEPSYAERQHDLLQLLQRRAAEVDARVPVAEQRSADHTGTVEAVTALLGPHLEQHRDLTPYVGDQARSRR